MIMACQQKKTQISVSENFSITLDQSRDVLIINVSMPISMHMVLGWASSCMNYCINAPWHRGDQSVALHRCNESLHCFDGCLQVICLVGSDVSHLPPDNSP
ncbi:hypothetical protein AMECASPLE_034873 [Ameca splendens]|uniref:Uncharacterized protein n=1 Tax=Ameca splendens TaxID=208324 RepID=A0ABV0YUB3_9TELE